MSTSIVDELDQLIKKAVHVGRLDSEHVLAQHVHACAGAGDPKIHARRLMDAAKQEWQRAFRLLIQARARFLKLIGETP